MESVKGKLFEFFVYRLLYACGFKPVFSSKDDNMIFDGAAGLMVHGLGQPHNADVLFTPPLQTPFYCPTRLLVECKCYNEPVGLPQVRNVLGLRDDINSIEIVTQKILRARERNWDTDPKYFPMKRFQYQVAVASLDGFCATAIAFAQAHRIPLISFSESSIFSRIRECIDKISSKARRDSDFRDAIIKYMTDKRKKKHYEELVYSASNEFAVFIEELKELEKRITIGLLEDGTLLFMIRADTELLWQSDEERYCDGFAIYWSSDDDKCWKMNYCDEVYLLELPKELYTDWKQTVSTKAQAIVFKGENFSYITLFASREQRNRGIEPVRHIGLSRAFIEKYR